MAKRSLESPILANPLVAKEAHEPMAIGNDPKADLLPLLATGASMGEALGLLVGSLGEVRYRPLWQQWSEKQSKARPVLEELHAVAVHSPVAANIWLTVWLEGKASKKLDLVFKDCSWLTTLPEYLEVAGTLDLRGTQVTVLPRGLQVAGHFLLTGTAIVSLPENLVVGDSLDCRNTKFAALPEGLKVARHLNLAFSQIRELPKAMNVGGNLTLTLCRQWDGRLPPDAQVGGLVFSEKGSPSGLSLAEWRERFPNGEPR